MNILWLEYREEDDINFKIDHSEKKSDSKWKSFFEDVFYVCRIILKSDPIGFSRIDRKHHGHDNIAYEPHCDDCDESPFCKIRTFPREYVGYQYESEECDNFSCDTTDKRKLTFESCLEECKNRTIDQSKECKNTRNTYTNECNVTVVSWKKSAMRRAIPIIATPPRLRMVRIFPEIFLTSSSSHLLTARAISRTAMV